MDADAGRHVAKAEEGILEASDAQASAYFGWPVDVDGDAVAVGAASHDVSGDTDAGKAYIFRYDDQSETWSEEDDLTAGDVEAGARFGSSLSLSGDRVAIGAPQADYNPGLLAPVTDSGAVYIFNESGGTWSQSYKLGATDATEDDKFGTVALDGDRLLVGASGATSSTGAIYVLNYDTSHAPAGWDEDQILTASDGSTSDQFGASVALDDDRFVTGAIGATIGTTNNAGAAYVFDFDSPDWEEAGKVSALVPAVPAVANHSLGDHRARFRDDEAGRLLTRDPLYYVSQYSASPSALWVVNSTLYGRESPPPVLNVKGCLFTFASSAATDNFDSSGLISLSACRSCLANSAMKDPDIRLLVGCARKTRPGNLFPCLGKIQCTCCLPGLGGWYNPFAWSGDLAVCANNVATCSDAAETLKHELVHAVMMCRGFFPEEWDGMQMGENRCQSCLVHELMAYSTEDPSRGGCLTFDNCLQRAKASCRMSLSCLGDFSDDEAAVKQQWEASWSREGIWFLLRTACMRL